MSIVRLFSVFLCLFFLSGCSWLDSWISGWDEKPAHRNAASNVRVVQPNSNMAAVQRKELEIPAMQSRPPVPVSTVSQYTPASVEQRIERLETSVVQIHDVLSQMQPALQRLAGLEVDLGHMVRQIEPAAGSARQEYGHVPAQQGYGHEQSYDHGYEQPYEQPHRGASQGNDGYVNNYTDSGYPQELMPSRARQQQSLAPLVAHQSAEPYGATDQPQGHGYQQAGTAPSYAAVVSNIRIGEHPGKTRLVLDISNSVPFEISQVDGGRTLVIDLPTAGWNASPMLRGAKSPLVQGFSSQTNGHGGTRLMINLKRSARVLWAEELKPAAGKGPRIAIDLAAI